MNIFNFIKTRVSILDVVSQYAALKKNGLYWKGCCPFHHERTASFTVSPHKEIYYCFGCNAGGDVIDFISRVEHCSQIEAAQHLAEQHHITLPENITHENSEAHADHKKRYFALCAAVARWCTKMLTTNAYASAYLEQRGITSSMIDHFSLGYFPGGAAHIKSLLNDLKKESFLLQDLINARIVLEGKNYPYSPFEERIIFPIKDHLGRFCGFGGRIFKPNDDRAKYYNSHDHEFFNKSAVMFAFDQAKKIIQEKGQVFLVEGYTDCIAMVQAGYYNTIATLGTACTLEHLKILARHAHRIYVMYDGDAAGQKAMLRLTQLCWQVDLELFVITLPQKDDPASFLQKENTLTPYILQAQDIFFFFVEQMGKEFLTKSLHDRLAIMKTLLDTIITVADPLKRDMLLQKAASTCNIPFETLKYELKRVNEHAQKEMPSEHASKNESPAPTLKQIPVLEKKLFAALIQMDISLDKEDEFFLTTQLTAPLAELYKYFLNFKNYNQKERFNHFFELLSPKQQQAISRLLLEYEMPTDQGLVMELFAQFQKKQWKMIVNDVKMKLTHASQASQPEEVQKILYEFQQLKEKMAHKGLL